jgi:hypothetical protein
MFRRTLARSLGIIGLAAILAAPLAQAQDSPPVVKARDGAELKIALADNAQIPGIIKASLSDIKQNSFLGVTAMPQPDGSQNPSKCTSFLKRCAAPAKDIIRGI